MLTIEERIDNLESANFQTILMLVNKTVATFNDERKNVSISRDDYSETSQSLIKLEEKGLNSIKSEIMWYYIKEIIKTDSEYCLKLGNSVTDKENLHNYRCKLGEIYMNMLGY